MIPVHSHTSTQHCFCENCSFVKQRVHARHAIVFLWKMQICSHHCSGDILSNAESVLCLLLFHFSPPHFQMLHPNWKSLFTLG